MSRHYGRTTLLQLYGGLFLLLALLMLCTSGAEAYDFSEAARITNMETGVTSGAYYYIAPSTQDDVRSDEVAALLERCLEYVRDGDALRSPYSQDLLDNITLTNVKYDSDKSLAEDRIRAAEREVKRLKAEKDAIEKETKLRRDIEALLGKLRKGE